jgi:hypothetical protein
MPKSRLLRDLAHSLGKALKIGYCPKNLNATIEALGLPTWLEQLLWWSWINKGGIVHGGSGLYSVAEIVKHHELTRYLSEKMLPIGWAANGDEIVIRFDDEGGEVGMISHEEVYKSQQLSDVYHQVVPSLEEFLLRIVDRMYLPIDSFAAREYRALRVEMGLVGRSRQ